MSAVNQKENHQTDRTVQVSASPLVKSYRNQFKQKILNGET